MIEFSITGQDQPNENLPLGLSKAETADDNSTSNDDSRWSSTISGSGLWHSGQPDLIQWVTKLLMPGRNVRIGELVESIIVVDGSTVSPANKEQDAGLEVFKPIFLRHVLSPNGWFGGKRLAR